MKPAPCSLAGTISGIDEAAIGALVLVVVAKHRVVDGQNGAAAVAEDRIDALVGHHLHDRIGAAQRLTGERVLG